MLQILSNPFIFIIFIALLNIMMIFWGFKTLPNENWQFMAVVPKQKTAHGKWKGLNLTYYGFLCANAYTFAVVVFLILSASVSIPSIGLCALVASILAICLPASKIIARIVEKKSGTLTVGGAVFAGTICAPWVVLIINHTLGQLIGFQVSISVFLAGISVAYAFGEGLGRLACISFGCCYGKPLSQCSPLVQKLFSKFYLTFKGDTKKISYASGLAGEKILPIQIITASLYCASGLLGTWLFLNGYFFLALLESLLITQFWRFASEFLRADFRGSLKITPYQLMSLVTVAYAAAIAAFFPDASPAPNLLNGLQSIWTPWMILFIQGVWMVSFLHTARSEVTGAEISFHVEESKI